MQVPNQQNQGYPQNYNYPTNPQANYNYPSAIQQMPNDGHTVQGQPMVGGYQPQFIPGSPLGYNYNQPQPMMLPRTADGVRFPVEIECQYCKRGTKTRIEYRSGSHAYCCGCILLFTFPICFCLPCLMDDQKDVVHFCTQCNHQVGFQKKKACD